MIQLGLFALLIAIPAVILYQMLAPRTRSGQPDVDRPQSIGEEPDLEPWTPGRNDPCPCGSGVKYKRCCGKSE